MSSPEGRDRCQRRDRLRQLAKDRERLRRERLVEFDDVGHGQVEAAERRKGSMPLRRGGTPAVAALTTRVSGVKLPNRAVS